MNEVKKILLIQCKHNSKLGNNIKIIVTKINEIKWEENKKY